MPRTDFGPTQCADVVERHKESEFVCLTTDGAKSSLKVGDEEVKAGTIDAAVHTLQLCVNDALDIVASKPVITAAKAVINAFINHQSLREAQRSTAMLRWTWRGSRKPLPMMTVTTRTRTRTASLLHRAR